MNYTSEQQAIANYREDELLVRGIAGSGKTLSLLANAIKRAEESSSLLFITFNKPLNQKIESMWGNNSKYKIEIKNFHSWAYGEISKVYGRPNKPLWDNDKKNLIKTAIENISRNYDNRFINYSDENFIVFRRRV